MSSLPGALTEKIEAAAELIAENFFDDNDEWLSIPVASEIMGFSAQSAYEHIKARKIPFKKFGSRLYVQNSIAEKVKELRELHGRDWISFTDWPIDASYTVTPDEPEHEVMELDDNDWSRFWNMMRRARTLYDKGNASGAADVVFAACDEFEVL